jgi:hypothetical protein
MAATVCASSSPVNSASLLFALLALRRRRR